jgi:hypothetical protein
MAFSPELSIGVYLPKAQKERGSVPRRRQRSLNPWRHYST